MKSYLDRQLTMQHLLKSDIVKPDVDRNKTYKEHCLYTIEEIIESLRNINRKPWQKTPQPEDIGKLKDELIDEFRFFLNRCLLVGMTPEEFEERFEASLEKTKDRINQQY